MSERVWITWENQRRNRTLSEKLGARLLEFDIQLPFILRYPISMGKTVLALISARPKIIFSQNPSLVLALQALVLSKTLKSKLVVDAHNAGLFPLEGRHATLNWLAGKICKWTDLTIVSNVELEKHVESLGGRAISIPDPIPNIDIPETLPELKGAFNILFICSWADDEPFLEAINAASSLDSDTYIYITGNSRSFERTHKHKLPGNVILTGFMSDDLFSGMLYACDCTMVLTYRDNCLLCGAYEGEAAGKPLILSDTTTLRGFFRKGSTYTENNAISISKAIRSTRDNITSLTREISDLKKDHESEFANHINTFEDILAR